ncbi:Polyadenylate-binding protein 2-like protein [Drosera capensis]
MSHSDVTAASTDVEEMRKKLSEMEDEAAAIRDMQAKVEMEMQSAAAHDPTAAAAEVQANKEEIDARSVFVGNVDYVCTPEEVHQHFQSCGTVNRVTIRTNKYGQPKGFAYVEFLEPDAIQAALLLNDSELHGRLLKVLAKRTNVPGMKQFHPQRSTSYMGFHVRGAYPPPPFYSPYGYGAFPRFRMQARYYPY